MASSGNLSVIFFRMRLTTRALSSKKQITATLLCYILKVYSVILRYRWENVKEGMFRIVDSIALANLWATVKGNKSMNYEKLSRAMRSHLFWISFSVINVFSFFRYYYKINVFAIVEGRRLVYKFGPMATGWKPNNGKEEKTNLNVGPSKRCKKCLCLFLDEDALKVMEINWKSNWDLNVVTFRNTLWPVTKW